LRCNKVKIDAIEKFEKCLENTNPLTGTKVIVKKDAYDTKFE